MERKRILVIGGGAAGFFCAVNIARMNPEAEVSIVEKTSKLLSKVRISGGGRCNVTHACFSIPDMLKKYPRGAQFLKKAFHHFFTTDTIEWFKARQVVLHEEADGRMFPVTNSSQTIIECLMQEANKYGVRIVMNSEVKKVEKKENGFELFMGDDRALMADYVCIACGGYPKTSMFEWLQSTGHHFEEPVPSLFTF
jgi:predicted Rossmann fold flavoprotein